MISGFKDKEYGLLIGKSYFTHYEKQKLHVNING